METSNSKNLSSPTPDVLSLIEKAATDSASQVQTHINNILMNKCQSDPNTSPSKIDPNLGTPNPLVYLQAALDAVLEDEIGQNRGLARLLKQLSFYEQKLTDSWFYSKMPRNAVNYRGETITTDRIAELFQYYDNAWIVSAYLGFRVKYHKIWDKFHKKFKDFEDFCIKVFKRSKGAINKRIRAFLVWLCLLAGGCSPEKLPRTEEQLLALYPEMPESIKNQDGDVVANILGMAASLGMTAEGIDGSNGFFAPCEQFADLWESVLEIDPKPTAQGIKEGLDLVLKRQPRPETTEAAIFPIKRYPYQLHLELEEITRNLGVKARDYILNALKERIEKDKERINKTSELNKLGEIRYYAGIEENHPDPLYNFLESLDNDDLDILAPLTVNLWEDEVEAFQRELLALKNGQKSGFRFLSQKVVQHFTAKWFEGDQTWIGFDPKGQEYELMTELKDLLPKVEQEKILNELEKDWTKPATNWIDSDLVLDPWHESDCQTENRPEDEAIAITFKRTISIEEPSEPIQETMHTPIISIEDIKENQEQITPDCLDTHNNLHQPPVNKSIVTSLETVNQEQETPDTEGVNTIPIEESEPIIEDIPEWERAELDKLDPVFPGQIGYIFPSGDEVKIGTVNGRSLTVYRVTDSKQFRVHRVSFVLKEGQEEPKPKPVEHVEEVKQPVIKPSSCIVNPFVDTEKPAPLNKDRINQALADAQKASRERLARSEELLQEERDRINKRQEELFGK